MAFVALDKSDSSRARVAFSVGPLKQQLMKFTAASGDTSGVITADALVEISMVMINSVVQTAPPVFSGNQATLTFADPLQTIAGDIIVYGV